MGDLEMWNELENLKRDLQNLNPDDGNARIDLNRRLIERYPFLEIRGRNASESRNLHSTWLDQMPDGWKKTLGIQLSEELREELCRTNPSLLNTYSVFQVKEKYGSLRWHDNGHSDRIDDILIKFRDISQHTCIICGRIDVPIFGEVWICPFCTECFIKYYERVWGEKMTDEQVESFIVQSHGLTRNTIVEISSLEGTEKRRIDFSDTLRALGVDPDSLPTIEEVLGLTDIDPNP